MVNVYYDVICRDCTAYVSTNHLSNLKIKDTNSETDFSISKKLEELRGEKYPCSKCGSLNSQIINIKTKGVKFFDKSLKSYYEDEGRIYIAINIEKTPFSEPTIKTNISQMTSTPVIMVTDYITRFLNNHYCKTFWNTNPYGHFDIICSAKVDLSSQVQEVSNFRIDKLVICGFSKDIVQILLSKFREDILNKKHI